MINDNQQLQRRILLGIVTVMVLASVWIVDQSAQADSAAALRQVALGLSGGTG